jgi:hypothetical protein
VGDRIETIAAGPIAPRRRDPVWIAPLLTRGLAADAAQRWPTLQALLDAIAARRRPRRWRWLAIGAAALGTAATGAAVQPAVRHAGADSVPLPYSLRVALPTIASLDGPISPTPLARYDHLAAAAISPDGTQLAIVTGDSLVIQTLGRDAADRTVVQHGVSAPVTWSPDNRHLLVGAVRRNASVPEAQLVDLDGRDDRAAHPLPVPGLAAFLAADQLAIASSYRSRSVAIYRRGDYIAPEAICEVPGDYTFLWSVAGLRDGTIVVETSTIKTGAHALVMLHRDCRFRAAFSRVPLAGVATTDTGTIVAFAEHDGIDDLLEITPDARIASRRQVRAALGSVLGRRHGVDYVTTLALRTTMLRIDGSGQRPVFSVGASASFDLAPDGETVAWVERTGHGHSPGWLWRSDVHDMTRRWPVLRDALEATWSPDGRSLAALVADGDPAADRSAPRPSPHLAIAVTDRGGIAQRRVALSDLDPDAAPVWLDDHRIAARTDDRTTYRWIDLATGEHGELVDRRHGSTLWLARSPRDGTLAMWRMGTPGATSGDSRGLWLVSPGGDPAPLSVADVGHFLLPSWSPSGELLVRAFETGVVSRAALDTGALTAIAQVPAMPIGRLFDDHVMTLPGGDLLAVDHELGADIAAVVPGGAVVPQPEPADDRGPKLAEHLRPGAPY